MKVLLVNALSSCFKEKPVIPLGLLSLATFLRGHGHEVRVFDRAVEAGGIGRPLRAFAPDVVGISVISSKSFHDGLRVSRAAKKRGIPVIWGGLTPSMVPQLVLGSGVVDAVVIGEGEKSLLGLVGAFSGSCALGDVEGIAYLENGETVLTARRHPSPLKTLPQIDYSFVDPNRYIVTNVSGKRMLHTYTSKGCPGSCAYCYNPSYCAGRWRPRPPHYYLGEVEWLLKHCDIDAVTFIDDLFSPGEPYTLEVCRRIKDSGLNFLWGCDMRADTCSENELRAMFDAGCRWIFFGIESGSPRMQRLIDKNLDLVKARQTLETCARLGITTTTSFIVGFPGETREDLMQTVAYALSLPSDVKMTFSFGPIPGSALYERLVAEGRLEPPRSCRRFGALKWFDTFGINYSEVPTLDFKVITAWFILSIIRKKHFTGSKSRRTWYRRMFSMAALMLKRVNLASVKLIFSAAHESAAIVFYARMFPSVRRKYGLVENAAAQYQNPTGCETDT